MKYLVLPCCLLALAGIAVAGEPQVSATSPGEIATIVEGNRVAPEYPPAAMNARFDGSVVLAVVIERDGTVGEIEVTYSDHPNLGFEQAAIDAVKQWRFEPARKNDIALPSVAAYSLHFEVAPRGSMHGGYVSGYHLNSAFFADMGNRTSPAATLLGDTDPMRPDRSQLARLFKVGKSRRRAVDAAPGKGGRRKSPVQPNLPNL